MIQLFHDIPQLLNVFFFFFFIFKNQSSAGKCYPTNKNRKALQWKLVTWNHFYLAIDFVPLLRVVSVKYPIDQETSVIRYHRALTCKIIKLLFSQYWFRQIKVNYRRIINAFMHLLFKILNLPLFRIAQC